MWSRMQGFYPRFQAPPMFRTSVMFHISVEIDTSLPEAGQEILSGEITNEPPTRVHIRNAGPNKTERKQSEQGTHGLKETNLSRSGRKTHV